LLSLHVHVAAANNLAATHTVNYGWVTDREVLIKLLQLHKISSLSTVNTVALVFDLLNLF
jgi:hypothetical protein